MESICEQQFSDFCTDFKLDSGLDLAILILECLVLSHYNRCLHSSLWSFADSTKLSSKMAILLAPSVINVPVDEKQPGTMIREMCSVTFIFPPQKSYILVLSDQNTFFHVLYISQVASNETFYQFLWELALCLPLCIKASFEQCPTKSCTG